MIDKGMQNGTYIKRFLDLIAYSEGTSTSPVTVNDGYDSIVTGLHKSPEVFTDYSDHPFRTRPPQIIRLVPKIQSTAAGRYQILLRTYEYYAKELNLHDFTPLSQDCIAVELVKERIPLDVIPNAIVSAIHACATIWASFPGNVYGQGGKSMDTLVNRWKELTQSIASPTEIV